MTEPEFFAAFHRATGHEPRHRPIAVLDPADAGPYATRALAGELTDLAAAPKGTRNDRLNVAAWNMATLVGAGYMAREEAEGALRSCALSIGLGQAETDATLRSAFSAGLAHPRQVEARDPLADVPAATGYDPPPATPGDDETERSEGEAPPPSWTERFPALDWGELWRDQSEDDWLLEPLIPARRLVALFSPPKVGKSLLMLEIAVRLSAGTTILGVTPDRARTVLYVDFENDPRGDIRSRLKAMGVGPGDLAGLHYLSFPRLSALDSYVGGYELLETAKAYGAELVIIDTISRAVSGEENENDTWLRFYRHTGAQLKAAGIACVRLDHSGKDVEKGMRGGSAKYGDVDAVWKMKRLSDSLYHLECTDNRLPIGLKELTVRREFTPYLTHAVDMDGIAGHHRREFAEAEKVVRAVLAEKPDASQNYVETATEHRTDIARSKIRAVYKEIRNAINTTPDVLPYWTPN